MKYKKFIINNYRGIDGPLSIDIERDPLIPIIGVNESGKTTILHAILAFDRVNDKQNGGLHINDAANLFKSSPLPPIVTAEIELDWQEFLGALNDAREIAIKENAGNQAKSDSIQQSFNSYKRKKKDFQQSIIIQRNLINRTYSIKSAIFQNTIFNSTLATSIILSLPYILYFDDFRDSVEDEIEIVKEDAKGWLLIIEQLFKKTDSQFSVFNLPSIEARRRKGVIAKVEKYLNETLTRQWQDFQLEEINALNISLEFIDKEVNSTKRFFLKLDVVETDSKGDRHFFFIRNRSKGFFWFFNFVMKLEFNPKLAGSASYNAIYLLDEPGSYLHASAQQKLCKKLRRLSNDNRVLYCTHSHYLLDPEVIPVNRINIADKNNNGSITLSPITSYAGNVLQSRGAFQPIWDALQIKPFSLEITSDLVIIVEGISDYYAFECFKGSRNVRVMPSVGASSIQYFISLMIAWHIDYRALWDNDDEGRKCRRKAAQHFGNEEAERRFLLLPKEGRKRKTILEDLFEPADKLFLRGKLNLSSNSSLDKVIMALYYFQDRDELIRTLPGETLHRFEVVFDSLKNDKLKHSP